MLNLNKQALTALLSFNGSLACVAKAYFRCRAVVKPC